MHEGTSELARTSLSSSAADRVVLASTFVLLAAGIFVGMTAISHAFIWGGATVAVALTPLLLTVFVLSDARRRREMRRLRAIRYAFNRDEYLETLGYERAHMHLRAVVVFDVDTTSLREPFESRCRKAGIDTVTWHARSVEIVSKRYVTEARSKGRSSYDNGPVHRCLRRTLAVLADVEANAPIVSLRAVVTDRPGDREFYSHHHQAALDRHRG